MWHKITLVGNLGQDPELRYMPSGDGMCNLSVATNRKYNKNGETITETCWFRVTVWGKTAEACNQYLRKGSKVVVEGHLSPDPETGNPKLFTRKDGTPSASYEIRAETVKFLDSKDD